MNANGEVVKFRLNNAPAGTVILSRVRIMADVMAELARILQSFAGPALVPLPPTTTGPQEIGENAKFAAQSVFLFADLLGLPRPFDPPSQPIVSSLTLERLLTRTATRGRALLSVEVTFEIGGQRITVIPLNLAPFVVQTSVPPPAEGAFDPSHYIFTSSHSEDTPECPAGVYIHADTVVDPETHIATTETRCLSTFTLLELTNVPATPDYDIAGGHFFSQASGAASGQGGIGHIITNDGDLLFWSEFQRLGGTPVVGYPASSRIESNGFHVQVMQKAVFQWRPERNEVWFENIFDQMHDAGKDDFLLAFRQIPPPRDTTPDAYLPGCVSGDVSACMTATARRHFAFLDEAVVPQAIRDAYWGDSDALTHWGLPMGVDDFGPVVVVRAQRAAFQYWREDQPFAKAGQVTVVNGGDLSKESGMWDLRATLPVLAPAQ